MKILRKIVVAALALCMLSAVFSGCAKDNGAQNPPVNGWHYGNGTPDNSLGADGDLYLDYDTWDVYTKENGAWTSKGNIEGDCGDKGEQGDKGDRGEQGNGWLSGKGIPSDTLGRDGDSYIDTSTWDVYFKEDGVWKFCDNIDSGSSYNQDYFKEMILTDGKLMVFSANDEISGCTNVLAKRYFGLSVQGLFAQIGNSKYYYQAPDGATFDWLDRIKTKYKIEVQENVTLGEMCADFKNSFKGGYVLYDISDSQSINSARTIAGARQLVMVEKSMEDWAQFNGLTKMIDATSMTAEECFDTYHNELDNGGLVHEYGEWPTLTDYSIACKYFCYYPIDSTSDPDPDITRLRNKVHAWCAGAPVYGNFPVGEYHTTRYAAENDSPTIVGEGIYNITVMGCVDTFGKDSYVQPYKPANATLGTEEYPLDKHYVTVVNGDGDNIGCWYSKTIESGFPWNYDLTAGNPNIGRHMYLMDAERQDFPMGWEINPVLAALQPDILDHIYSDVAQPGDTFVCSISGFGLTFPRYYSDKALKRMTNMLDEYIGKCDLSVVKIIDDGNLEHDEEYKALEAYTQMKNAEGFLYCTHGLAYIGSYGRVRWVNDKPIVACRETLWQGWGEPDEIAARVNNYPTDSTKIDGYTYVNLHIWSKDYTDAAAMVDAFDSDVQVVDPITFIRLIKERVPHEDATPEDIFYRE